MTKSLDSISDVLQSGKNPFKQTDARPYKAQKHRYERRKIKQMIQQSDWADGQAPARA